MRIIRFKSIGDLTLDLGHINVLVGGNNSGKSTVLHAIQFAVSVAQTLHASRWTRVGRKPGSIASNELVYAPLRDITALAPKGNLSESKEKSMQIALSEGVNGEGVNESCSVMGRRGRNKNTTFEIDGRALGSRLEKIDKPYSILVPGLSGIPEQEDYRPPAYVRKAAARGDANSVLRNILALLQMEPKKWQQFHDDLHSVFPECDLTLRSTRENDELVDVRLSFAGVPSLPIDAAGTGILQAIQILSYVDLYEPSVLLLDEPDAHLHPTNQRKLASLLRMLAEERDVQVLLATHSRHILDALYGTAEVVWLDAGKRVNTKPEYLQVLMDLGALDQTERLRTDEKPAVVLTEDANPDMLRVLMKSSRWNLDDAYIWSYKGCTNEGTAILVAAVLRDIIPNVQIVVHRDRDYLSEIEINSYLQRMEDHKLSAFITEGTSVEAYFLNPDHLAKVNSDGITSAEFETIILTATTDAEQYSIETLTNSFFARDNQDRRGNAGAAAIQAQEEYRANPMRYRHAKSVLKRVKALYQSQTGNNLIFLTSTEHLSVQSLASLAPTPQIG